MIRALMFQVCFGAILLGQRGAPATKAVPPKSPNSKSAFLRAPQFLEGIWKATTQDGDSIEFTVKGKRLVGELKVSDARGNITESVPRLASDASTGTFNVAHTDRQTLLDYSNPTKGLVLTSQIQVSGEAKSDGTASGTITRRRSDSKAGKTATWIGHKIEDLHNRPPEFRLGGSNSFCNGGVFTMNIDPGAVDPDGDPVTYTWAVDSTTLSTKTPKASLKFRADCDFEKVVVSVVASDGAGGRDETSVEVLGSLYRTRLPSR